MSRFVKPLERGKASEWTPRQALLQALQEVDDYDAVVISLANTKDDTTRSFASAPSALIRDGIIHSLSNGTWPSA